MEMQLDDYDYSGYVYTGDGINKTTENTFNFSATCLKEKFCISLIGVSTVVFLLGISGNALVIWITGFKMKKSVNTTWYLSLAISDFVFCAFIPLTIAHMALEDWIFGPFMCKFAPSVMFINMFSSIFLLVIISVDRCVSVMFPVWAQNQRTARKASIGVVLAWILAIGFSLPSMIFREVKSLMGRNICFNNYSLYENSHGIVAMSRFIAGFILPFTIISICYLIIICRLRNNNMAKSSKPFKVMTALIATFFICWLPYHVFILLELNHTKYNVEVLSAGLQISTYLASANSFLNPVLYVFMGNDFKQKFRSCVLSRMENAMGEEGRTISRYLTKSSSMDGRASTLL